jgi:hypothetical protein
MPDLGSSAREFLASDLCKHGGYEYEAAREDQARYCAQWQAMAEHTFIQNSSSIIRRPQPPNQDSCTR